jgi:hypothetical protein
MTTITDTTKIRSLLPSFEQTILSPGGHKETVEHGFINKTAARIIYQLPATGNYDSETGEFLGNWEAHIIRMEIDDTHEKYADISDQTAAAAVDAALAYCEDKNLPTDGVFDAVHESLAQATGDKTVVNLINNDPESYGIDVIIEAAK